MPAAHYFVLFSYKFSVNNFSPRRSLTYESANISQSASSVIIPDEFTPLGTSQADFVLLPPSAVTGAGESASVLVPAVVYTATLQGVAQGTAAFGAASIRFVINQPPQSGTCQACRCYLQDDVYFSTSSNSVHHICMYQARN